MQTKKPLTRAQRAEQLRNRAAKLESLDRTDQRKRQTRGKIIAADLLYGLLQQDAELGMKFASELRNADLKPADRDCVREWLPTT